MSELIHDDLLTVAQAIAIIDAIPVVARIVEMPLIEAQGLRLADDIRADRDYPPFDKSLMDGFAVRAADLAGGLRQLRVVGEIAAGVMPARELAAGEAMAIMTGAPLPRGADGVVPVEATSGWSAESGQNADAIVKILNVDNPARYVALRGNEMRCGDIVLRRGDRLEAAQMAVAASVGAANVRVFARPRVAVLATGDELVPIDGQPNPAQIRNSNSVMLVGLLRSLGCDATDLGVAGDQPGPLRLRIEAARDFDALFITGGMSMGRYDYVPRVLEELGVSLRITKLRIKPGKPFIFGAWESAGGTDAGESAAPAHSTQASRGSAPPPLYIFGLPGNPVSGFVCTVRLASRLLARLAGGEPSEIWLSGRLATAVPANGPREFYQPVLRHVPQGNRSSQNSWATITPLDWKGSADIRTLAAANALLVRGENEPALGLGTLVRVLGI